MRQCTHRRRGIVTNQNPDQPYDRTEAHASRQCCDRADCIAAAQAWVAKHTNRQAEFYSDSRVRPAKAGA